MKQKFDEFLKSSWGLELWLGNEIIFRSKKSGVRGLLDFILASEREMKACLHFERARQENGESHINERSENQEDIIIFDKIVGQAVAFLAAYLKAKEVYGATGSELAAQALEKHKIKFYFRKTVPNILNKDKTDLCPMEKLSIAKTPEEFYNSLKQNVNFN
ncbi:MAG: DUF1893 domain-containing protein [Candidatus Nealsonbacteria bacterium]